MIRMKMVASSSWDFTLYRTDDGSYVMKVVFSEGEFKIDVQRYFVVDPYLNTGDPLNDLKALSARIRTEYPDTALRQVCSSDVQITAS